MYRIAIALGGAMFWLAASSSGAHPAHDTPPPANHMYDAVGAFLKSDARNHTADIAYEYNETLGWPSARMTFAVAPQVTLAAFKKNARVQFMLHKTPAGSMIIVLMCPTAAPAPLTGQCGPAPNMRNGHEGHDGNAPRESDNKHDDH